MIEKLKVVLDDYVAILVSPQEGVKTNHSSLIAFVIMPTSSSSSSDSDDEDELLMLAASSWAEKDAKMVVVPTSREASSARRSEDPKFFPRKNQKERPKATPNPNNHARMAVSQSRNRTKSETDLKASPCSPPVPTKKLSVHVTQISFDATLRDLRAHFHTPIVRMVRKNGEFTGVAFCDYNEDETLYKRALALHRTTWLGRAINVRPVRTPEELQLIVLRRGQAKDAERLKRDNDAKSEEKSTLDSPSKKKQRKKRKAAIIHSRQHQKRK